MFDILHTNFFKLNQQKFKTFEPYFKDVFQAYDNIDDGHNIASIKLLTLLYQLKQFTKTCNAVEESFKTPQQILFQKFAQLVNHFYLEKKTVDEYADMLAVSPNHLSQAVKQASNQNALHFITDRIITEAKSMIRFSILDIAEIVYQLGFTDTSNFGKFFKRHAHVTPLEYRRLQKG